MTPSTNKTRGWKSASLFLFATLLLTLIIIYQSISYLNLFPPTKAEGYPFVLTERLRFGADEFQTLSGFKSGKTSHYESLFAVHNDSNFEILEYNPVEQFINFAMFDHSNFEVDSHPVDLDGDNYDEILLYEYESDNNNLKNIKFVNNLGIIKNIAHQQYETEKSDSALPQYIELISNSKNNRAIVTDNYFYIGCNRCIGGTDCALHVYSRGKEPKLVNSIEMNIKPDDASAFIGQDNSWQLLITGSNMSCYQNVLERDILRPGSGFNNGFLDPGIYVSRLDEHCNTKWINYLGNIDGKSSLFLDSDNSDFATVICYRVKENNIADDYLKIYKIDMISGMILSEERIDWSFYPVKSKRVSDIAGLIISPDHMELAIIGTDGSIGESIAFISYEKQPYIPLININGTETIAIKERFGDIIFLSATGERVALRPGSSIAGSMEYKDQQTTYDMIAISQNNDIIYYQIEQNSIFKRLFYTKSMIIYIIILPLVVAIVLYFLIERIKNMRTIYRYEAEDEPILYEDNPVNSNGAKAELNETIDSPGGHTSRIEQIVSNMKESVIVINRFMIITYINKSFCEMYNVDFEKTLRQRIDNTEGNRLSIFSKIASEIFIRGKRVDGNTIKMNADVNNLGVILMNVTPILNSNSEYQEIIIETRLTEQVSSSLDAVDSDFKYQKMISRNPEMLKIFNLIEDLNDTISTILIQGESGTGKELVAAAIHNSSPRSKGPFIRVNCGALSENLLESELFGHVKGAFTGAIKDRIGRFEAAIGGTIFLDEIGEMSHSMQMRLLRVLQEGEFERVGDSRTIRTDARVLAATNVDLVKSIQNRRFRQDLYYRLNVVPIDIRPLRERKEDIPLLVSHFFKIYNSILTKEVSDISENALNILMRYNWPGNIRELENTIHRAMIMCREKVLLSRHLPMDIFENVNLQPSIPGINETKSTVLDETNVRKVISENKWVIAKAARQLGISRNYLYQKMKQYKIERPADIK
jgi:two-component system, NtrC family, response regulator HydG